MLAMKRKTRECRTFPIVRKNGISVKLRSVSLKKAIEEKGYWDHPLR